MTTGRLAVGVLALIAFNAASFWAVPGARHIVFRPDEWRAGERAAEQHLESGRAFLMDESVIAPWNVVEAENAAREAAAARAAGAQGLTSWCELVGAQPRVLGSYDVAGDWFVVPAIRRRTSRELELGDAAWSTAHDRRMRRAVVDDELTSLRRCPARVPTAAELRAAFDDATTRIADPAPDAYVLLRLGDVWLSRHRSSVEGRSRYSITARGAGVHRFECNWTEDLPGVLPVEGRSRFTMSADGNTLFVHDQEAHEYWGIDVEMGCVVATTAAFD